MNDRPAPAPPRDLAELRDAIDGLAPIVGPGLTSRLVVAVAQGDPEQMTAREALSVLTAQLAVLSQFHPSRAA